MNPMSEQLHDSYEKCYYKYKVLMNFVIARRDYNMKRDIFDDLGEVETEKEVTKVREDKAR